MHRKTILLIITLTLSLSACAPAQKNTTIGIVTPASSMEAVIVSIKTGMAEYGYIEGENITYLYNGPKTGDDLDAEASALVAQNVDLLIGLATPGALAAQRAVAGTEIPVVYAPISDPVGAGLAQSITAPGNNMTGVKSADFVPKELEWLLLVVPDTKTIYAPYNPEDGGAVYGYNLLVDAAENLNVKLIAPKIYSADDVLNELQNIPSEVDAIFMQTDSLILSQIDAFVATSHEKKLPLTSINYSQVEAGALLSYGPEFGSVGQQMALLIDQVLRGADAGALPVEDASYHLYLNQKVAKQLGITIPNEVLKAAEEIIR